MRSKLSKKPIKIKDCNPLPYGRYRVYGEKNNYSFRNFPEGIKLTAICKNEWVKFYNGRKFIWECSAVYAAAHFEFIKTTGQPPKGAKAK